MTTPPQSNMPTLHLKCARSSTISKRPATSPDVNNFWKYLAHDPTTLKRTWESVKQVMAPGALDPLVKEMIYVAVSVTNGCALLHREPRVAARKAGMTRGHVR